MSELGFETSEPATSVPVLTFTYTTPWFFFSMSYFRTSPGPTKTPLPLHDQPLPTTTPSGKGDQSHRSSLRHPPILATGHSHPHAPQEDLLLTLGHTPMPKALPAAIWCRPSSVLEAEKGSEVMGVCPQQWPAGQVVAVVGGPPRCRRRSQCLPQALIPAPEPPSLAAPTQPLLHARNPGDKSPGLQSGKWVLTPGPYGLDVDLTKDDVGPVNVQESLL